jgi:CHASE2 domain-containing sensor protein
MSTQKSARKSPASIGMLQRYIFIGAALGLYYGIFYRPSSADPDYGIAILLSIIAALITVVIRFWKKKQPFAVMLKDYFMMLVLYSAFLLMLAARHQVEQIGGRVAVAIFTTLTGICMGYLMATWKIFKPT